MLQHYILIAWRNIKRKRTLSFIQIFCLALGLAAFILVARYVQYEKQWDTFNESYELIYRAQAYKIGDRPDDYTQIPVPVAQYLEDNIPEIEKAFVYREIWFEHLSADKEIIYREGMGCWVPSDIFDVFSFELIRGDRRSVLDDPNSIVINESMAQKYFPNGNAIGQYLYDSYKNQLRVTGVMKDMPEQSHIQADYFRSSTNLLNEYKDDWYNSSFTTYVLLRPGSSAELVSSKIQDVINIHDENAKRLLYLNPLSTLHLKENPRDDRGVIVYMFSVMGLLTLLLACVSFMNLTTAFSSLRLVEVGVRKSIGSSRRSIRIQFISEAVVIAFIAFVLAVFIAALVLPIFNQVVDRNIELNLHTNLLFTLFLVAVVLLTGILAGAYPAFIVSAYKPINVLHGIKSTKKNNLSGLQVLVYLQFVISVVLITASLWVYRQVNLLSNKDLGFNKETVYRCSMPNQNSSISYEALRNDLLAHAGIENMAVSLNSPMHSNWGTFVIPEDWDRENAVFSRWNMACSNYISTMGMEIIKGRNFSENENSKTFNCLINETAAKAYGWANPIGKTLEIEGKHTVIGVIKDFNVMDVHSPIPPFVMLSNERDLSMRNDLLFKVHPASAKSALLHMQSVLDQHFNDVLFDVSHYDDNLERVELKIWTSAKKTIAFFTMLAVLVAALGLFGLVYYATQKRFKEIGIRKVQGAGVLQIIPMVTKHFVIMTLLANVIVFPVTEVIENIMPGIYKYHFTIFDAGLILVGTMAITLLSCVYQVVRASNLNPVEALRYE
ncbi:ABC transporter permease [Carboxylicivirga sp. M1479]|uniref:ABC transporter permease n=1 Tax=Carboxylicivirga sp. M1479 TaxID=2594476 RepID=UPI001177AFB3|nr:ABC transporter permease [Carboxylicivirga sp. M1479]TRX72662.1 FtsX-like permease family protein [Carboxylicivirga sp. M1479]